MTVRVKTPPQLRPIRYRRDSFEEARWAAAAQQKKAADDARRAPKTSLTARIFACFCGGAADKIVS